MGYLDHLLYAMRCWEATDTKDYLDALYGITSRISNGMQISNPLVAPDYAKDVVQVFAENCKAILSSSNSLLLLSNVEDRAGIISPVPSWCPAWRKDWAIGLPRCGSGAYYDASLAHTAPTVYPVLEHLTLEAYPFDAISALGESDYELGRGGAPFTKTASII